MAAFEENSPRLMGAGTTDAPTRSIIVNRDDAADAFRSAQLPPAESSSAGPTGTGDSLSEDRLRSPFSEPPAEPPSLETPIPPAERPIPAPQPRQPTLEQPAQAPFRQPTVAPPGQFQPVLPSGPTPPTPQETGGPVAPDTSTTDIQAEGARARESCDKSLENLRAYTVDKVNLNIAVTGTEGKDYPFECTIDDGQQFQGRCWDPITYMWKASALCHKPLYFEDEQLERYGHSWSPCFQPFVSGAHFFCTLPVLPYCMGVEPPCECIYALGHYRPGSCAPYMINPVPLSVRGAVIQTGAVWGAAAALP
jgi:hypothetical protein